MSQNSGFFRDEHQASKHQTPVIHSYLIFLCQIRFGLDVVVLTGSVVKSRLEIIILPHPPPVDVCLKLPRSGSTPFSSFALFTFYSVCPMWANERVCESALLLSSAVRLRLLRVVLFLEFLLNSRDPHHGQSLLHLHHLPLHRVHPRHQTLHLLLQLDSFLLSPVEGM